MSSSQTSLTSPAQGTFSSTTSRSRSSTKITDDVASLTSFNPFSEEDENEGQSSVFTSILSRVKSTLAAPLSSAVISAPLNSVNTTNNEPRRPSYSAIQTASHIPSRIHTNERPNSLAASSHSIPAPPLVSLTPAQSELPSYQYESERSPSRTALFYSPVHDSSDGGIFGNSIPGFPIQDDARSIKTTVSLQRSGSVSKVMRKIRGEGLSRDYWMDDENCKECYDCKTVFTTWRRKHHCRICGQIFCSRCASNVIKGSRFGHDGMIRVCNLCLEKLGKVDDDDDDDRRSVVSSVFSFPAHQLGLESIGLGHHPQSPFAASQLFGRSEEPFNLYSIAETKRTRSYSDDGGFSRPITPHRRDKSELWDPANSNPAPFRRALSDEDVNLEESTVFGTELKTTADFVPLDQTGDLSSVQFPVGSPDANQEGSESHWMRGRFNSYADFDVATPFIRSRVHSRLDNIPIAEPGWRTRRESTAYAQELNLTSLLHLKMMLRQMLTSENIPNVRDWEETLLKLALRIARELTFTTHPHRQGEDMDVRRYVKIKKIPGGTPHDSEYVDGAVITKNVAHKQMSRFQRNPRIMLVTFPLEFSRVEGQYLHFGQIVRQEKEYLGNLASRIAALRPHIVLVEKSVSRLALDALANFNIVVARTVKPSAIQVIRRMTQADVFSSMDKLALEPRLGHCARFRIQTYDHPLIPGQRKTYMRFEGCNRDMGCTIILRGADITTLRRIKKVARFLTFIVRNLKLETHLWKDSVISLPSFNYDNAFPNISPIGRSASHDPSMNTFLPFPSTIVTPRLETPLGTSKVEDHSIPSRFANENLIEEDLPHEEANQLKLTRRIDECLYPYTQRFISVSATLRFPAPYPLLRMKELDIELGQAKRCWEDEVIRREEKTGSHEQEATTLATSPVDEGGDDLKAQIDALSSVRIPGMVGIDLVLSPLRTEEASSYFSQTSHPPSSNSLPPTNHPFGNSSSILTPTPEQPNPSEPLKTVADTAAESRYNLIKWKHEEHQRVWEWYLRKNKDDFVVEKYQCISLLEYTVPALDAALQRPCFPPRLNYITFYGENDCTLGQFIEKSVGDTVTQSLDPKAMCTGKGCDQPLTQHWKAFVHNECRLFVAIEQWDVQIIPRPVYSNNPELLITWSACRICGSATPFIPVSEEMQRYSFAKYLELHFYPADVKLVQGAGCQHNIYQHHIRYFATKGMTVRFQADPITLHEVVYPPFRIHVRPEAQLELKNNDFLRLHERNLVWYTGLIDDLKLISIDAATGEEEKDAALLSDINALIARAETEREDIATLINRVYGESYLTDTLALNQVRSYRQDKIVAWQQDFDRLPKPKPIERALTKRSSAFGSVRAIWPRRYEISGALDHPHLPSSSVSEAEEGSLTMRRVVTGHSVASSASETSEAEAEPQPDKADVPTAPTTNINDDGEKGPPPDTTAKSDPESDSTIGAIPEDVVSSDVVQPSDPEIRSTQRTSRLPRRSNQPSVAELVKKYQDFIPPQGIQDLTKTAFPPKIVVSESEQEYSSPVRQGTRSKSRHRVPIRKQSTSDFEQGYAASIAPRYLTHSRRSLGHTGSRIPGPVGPSLDSRNSSRRPSPEKANFSGRGKDMRSSSPPIGKPSNGTRSSKVTKSTPGRVRDKSAARPSSTVGSKAASRRPGNSGTSKVSNIARHFERLGRDAERSRSRYNVIQRRRARPVASSRAKVEVFDSVKDAIKDEYESSDSSSEADDEADGDDEPHRGSAEVGQITESPDCEPREPEVGKEIASPPSETDSRDSNAAIQEVANNLSLQLAGAPSMPPSPFLTSFRPDQNVSMTPPHAETDIFSGTNERNSILKAISGFWLQPPPLSRNSYEGDDPMNDPEHIFRDSSMVVRTDEPTSIIALALNSPQYRDMLAKSRADKRNAREARLTEGGEAFMPDDRSVAESTSTWGVVNVDPSDFADPTEDLKVPSSKLPWAITFESGDLLISCTVLYPEQFDALRRTYDCEKTMIESLARCVKWNATGGKSGSAFLKTRDDRFIAKELSRPELQTMETFAPAYFDYMSSSVSAHRSTLLAKIFGCYKITFRKTGNDRANGKHRATQMNLLVMENLFYDRRFSKIYDLKGSTRNRRVQSTGRENEVLLDENLVETSHSSPFYVREHSKRILRGALYNDSKFLADINVMDYSLVCGVDSQNNELVIGIVDYIRTYTWDKKLESWVKESAFLGGGVKGEPTIVTPKQYRQRFLSAMERYFPLIPDRWMKQKDTPDIPEEDSTSLV